MILKEKIPSIYHSLFPELLEIEFTEERLATCDTCTLCRSDNSPYVNTKCCAYHPHMVNFLLGGILQDNTPSMSFGRSTILKQITKKAGVTPYGIIPPEGYKQRQIILDSQDFWSRPKEVIDAQLCPYYDNGHCSVWKYRENLCVTFFCSSIGGKSGKIFWGKLNKYLKMAETRLAQYAMLQLGWPPKLIKTDAVTTGDFKLEDEKGIVDEKVYSKIWWKWGEREVEFYKSCFDIISKLDTETFKSIAGLTHEILESAIKATSKDFLERVLPDIMILHPNLVTDNTIDGQTRLILGEEVVEIPTVIFPLIRGFNGKRTVLEATQLGYNILYGISTIVDELYQKGILIKI